MPRHDGSLPLEKRHIGLKLCTEDIRRMRNSTEMTEIIIGMRSLLDLMKSGNVPRQRSLMGKAVNYFDHFGNQAFLYRKDGEYTIDNSLTERCVWPLANERKNPLFFGSNKMTRVSAAYTPSCLHASFKDIQFWNTSRNFLQKWSRATATTENLCPQPSA